MFMVSNRTGTRAIKLTCASNGARLVSAKRERKNITNKGKKVILDHIFFCTMIISLRHILEQYIWVLGQNHTCKFPCLWLSKGEEGIPLSCLEHCLS